MHIEVNTSHLMMMMTMMIIIFQNHQSRQHIHCVHIQLIRSHTIASILPPKQFECQCQCIVTKLRQCNNSGCLESCKKNRSPKIMEINDPEKCWRCRSDWRCNTTRLCVCAWFSVSYYHHLTVFVFSQHIFRRYADDFAYTCSTFMRISEWVCVYTEHSMCISYYVCRQIQWPLNF